jgi:uncharacterized protein with GYD domain
MATYIALATFTDKGLQSIKQTTQRAAAAQEMAGKFGVRMSSIHWTQGQYDLVIVCEAQDEASISAFSLAIAAAGNVRFQTMRALTSDEMNGVLAKLP